jgi:hypothetical protein
VSIWSGNTKLSSVYGQAGDLSSRASQLLIEKHWPLILDTWRQHVLPTTVAFAKDDERFVQLAEAIYQALPLPVRVMIRQQDFITFCQLRRDLVLASEPHDKAAGR